MAEPSYRCPVCCGPGAMAALAGAWQFSLVDPEWGRRDTVLWPALEAFAAEYAFD